MGEPSGNLLYRFHSVEFKPRDCLINCNGETTVLDRHACSVFELLLARSGEIVSKDELIEAGWNGRIVHENSLAKAIGRIRQVLGDERDRLETVFGVGYQLQGEVEILSDTQPGCGESVARARRTLRSTVAANPIRYAAGAAVGLGTAILISLTIVRFDGVAAEQASASEADKLMELISQDLIDPADPYSSAPEPGLRKVVDQIAATMDERFADHPRSLVALHQSVSNGVSGWGEYDRAVAHLDAARDYAEGEFPPEAAEFARIDTSLCQQLRLSGAVVRASQVCKRAVKGARRHPELLAAAVVNLAKLDFEIGNYPTARNSLRGIIDAGDLSNPGQTADAWWFLALSERKLGNFEDSDTAFRRLVDLRDEQFGADHPLTAWARADYGDLLVDTGEFAAAEKELRTAQEIFTRSLGADHVETLSPQYSLALISSSRSDFAKARDGLVPILSRYRNALGADHFWTIYVTTELALVEAGMGNRTRAKALLGEARSFGAKRLASYPAKRAGFELRWAQAHLSLGELAAAEALLEQARSTIDSAFGRDHVWYQRVLCLEAKAMVARGRMEAGRTMAADCIDGLLAAKAPATYPPLIEAMRIARAR